MILRMGGVYADIDVELRQPLDSVVKPTDTMVVGWEAEVPDDAAAFKRHFVRKRQVRNNTQLSSGAGCSSFLGSGPGTARLTLTSPPCN